MSYWLYNGINFGEFNEQLEDYTELLGEEPEPEHEDSLTFGEPPNGRFDPQHYGCVHYYRELFNICEFCKTLF